jgi:hypothetical protein
MEGGMKRTQIKWISPLFVVALLTMAVVANAQDEDDDLESLLEQVGEDYAVGYSSPFLYAFGPNQNSGMYQTANIPWTGLTFGFGVKAMAAHMSPDDQVFQSTLEDVDLGEFDSDFDGQMGNVVMGGPTIFGDTETNGTIVGYLHGMEVFRQETIPGLLETNFVPLVTPEANIGGIFGLKATVRYFPEVDMGEYGKTKYLGYGIQWNANGVLKNLPVDIMVGFFTQELKVGDLLDTSANTYFAGVSKDFSVATLYGGFAIEDSEMTVTYQEEGVDAQVDFTVDGIQDSRFTIGAAFNFILKLNVEMGIGEVNTYSAGLMFGL